MDAKEETKVKEQQPKNSELSAVFAFQLVQYIHRMLMFKYVNILNL